MIVDPGYMGQEEVDGDGDRERRVRDFRGLALETDLLPHMYKGRNVRVGGEAG